MKHLTNPLVETLHLGFGGYSRYYNDHKGPAFFTRGGHGISFDFFDAQGFVGDWGSEGGLWASFRIALAL